MKAADAPPAALVEGLPAAKRERTGAWWATLGPEARVEFLQLWDERSDDTSLYGVVEEGCIRWHELPIELRGSLLDDDDPNGRLERREARQALLEYISNHEDIGFFFLDGKTFHVCRAHPEARARIQAGLLPASFTCPLADRDCPMRAILAAAQGPLAAAGAAAGHAAAFPQSVTGPAALSSAPFLQVPQP